MFSSELLRLATLAQGWGRLVRRRCNSCADLRATRSASFDAPALNDALQSARGDLRLGADTRVRPYNDAVQRGAPVPPSVAAASRGTRPQTRGLEFESRAACQFERPIGSISAAFDMVTTPDPQRRSNCLPDEPSVARYCCVEKGTSMSAFIA